MTSAIQFNSPLYVGYEEFGPPATTTVVRTGSLTGAASVHYDASAVMADRSEYFFAPGDLHFADGEASKRFTIAIKDERISEGDETFNLILSNPTGAALGAQSTTTILIPASDGTPVFAIGEVSVVVEGNSGTVDAVFTVRLSNPSAFTVTLDYETEDDAAVADDDYVGTSGRLTFSPGETEKTITVRVNGDTLEETHETFLVKLKNQTLSKT